MSTNQFFLSPGTILEGKKMRYKVESVLGFGGYGITYKVSTKTNYSSDVFYFAIKEYFVKDWCERKENSSEMIYSASLAEDVEDGKTDFISEAKRLIQLRHRNIMRVYEEFEANNTAYYVMDFVEGENLRSMVLKNGAMTDEEVYKWATPILEAVSYLQKNMIVHLDIKPANIMMKYNENRGMYPVLIDFGQSKHYNKEGRVTSTIRVHGCSDGYAPLEQYVGVEEFNPQADVYAVGASMVFCLTKSVPPKAVNLDDEKVYSLLPVTVDAKLRRIIFKSMSRGRKNRTKSAKIFLGELKRWHGEKYGMPKNGSNKGKKSRERKNAVKVKSKKKNKKWVWVMIFAIIVLLMSIMMIVYKHNKKLFISNKSISQIENRCEVPQDKIVTYS